MLPALRSFDRTFADFDRLWRELDGLNARSPHVMLPLNVHEDDEAFVLTSPLPGVSAEDLGVEAEADRLTLSASREVQVPEGYQPVHRERGATKAKRTLRFRVPIDTAGITATLENGLLTVRVPKAASARTRRIPVQAK